MKFIDIFVNDMFIKSDGYSKFEPKDRYAYSGAGQCIESVTAMTQTLPADKKPVIIALYESLNSYGYCMNPDIMEAHNLFPGAFLQIGLELPLHNDEELGKLGDGTYDGNIEEVAIVYKSIKLPVFLRIGYEFDGEWNGYEPKAYKRAYRRIVDIFRKNGAENVAFVWNSYISTVYNMFDWYPDDPDTGEKDGDNYVDWFCYNTMSAKFDAGWYMGQAAAHKKPVMIGESSYAIVKEGYTSEEWMKDFFKSIEVHGVKGYQYINWEWQVYPEHTNWDTWKNGRYTDDENLVKIYNSHMKEHNLIYRGEDYHDPIAFFVDCARGMKEAEGKSKKWERRLDHYTARQGYDYFVEGVSAEYGNGWFPYWESIDGQIKVVINVPANCFGYLIFSANSGYMTEPESKRDYIVSINGKVYNVLYDKGGYCKLPVNSTDTENGRLAVEICHKEKGRKVVISHIGIVIPHSKPLPAPENICLNAGDGAKKLQWKPVEGAFLYNIYRNHQLIGITDAASFNIVECGIETSFFSISAYCNKRGEGNLSDEIRVGK